MNVREGEITEGDRMQPSVVVKVNGRAWKVVHAFAKSGPTDTHYVIKTNGAKITINFGDGVHGAKPPSGSNVEATFRTGAGKAGKVTVSYRISTHPTQDQALWIAIRNRTNAISFVRYRRTSRG
jgi:hypothetical protein